MNKNQRLKNFTGNERAFLVLFLKLLILMSLIKLGFLLYNQPVLNISGTSALSIIKWSVFYDALIILLILVPFAMLKQFVNRFRVISLLFVILMLVVILLNVADIFYFRFQHQRANADLLYVIADPLGKSLIQNTIITLVFIGVVVFMFVLTRKFFNVFVISKENGIPLLSIIAGIILISLVIVNRKMLLPAYPLVQLKSNELQVSQNSFHTFLYSVFRMKESGLSGFDMDGQMVVFNNKTKITPAPFAPKNVVLFIMESVPSDFFEPDGRYNVELPFMDSIVSRSTYFQNAYSYSHNSNKGIVAILAGLPTLTDIPLYHSGFSGLPKTGVGEVLSDRGYTSSFFIGDGYDDFGFAKCCNWLGLRYYCKDDINLPKGADKHTMGYHDEYVLGFMADKLKQMLSPFFAVNFNLSTHYPNDLPKDFKISDNITLPMKAMKYYDQSLAQFFREISSYPSYSNTVFIFCADHWMYPDEKNLSVDVVKGFRIPVFIFDPARQTGRVVTEPISQLDIMNTVLAISGMQDSVISYGRSLTAQADPGRVVFSKENNMLYQAFDSSHVLGYNIVSKKTEFLYEIRDSSRKVNLAGKGLEKEQYLLGNLKGFLKTAYNHYRSGNFKN